MEAVNTALRSLVTGSVHTSMQAQASALVERSTLLGSAVSTATAPLAWFVPNILRTAWAEATVIALAVIFGLVRIVTAVPRWIRGGSRGGGGARLSPPECLSDPLLGRHLYVKIRGTKYHYVENGSRRQELVLLLHDFSDFWYGWRSQLRGLSGSNWVVAPDLKGFGDSDKPFLARQYKDQVLVEELKEFVDVLQEEEKKIIIIGHGLGGHLAWRFIERYPGSVSKFVSISTPHPRVWLRHVLTSWRNVLQNRWLYFCRLPFLPEMELGSHDLEVFDRKFSTQSGLTDLQHASLADKEAYKYSFSRTTDWQGPVNYLRNLNLADTSVLQVDKEGADRPIPVEALLIIGNRDPETGMDLVTQSAEYLERFAMHIVNGAGPAPHQEQPELVNKHIAKFIKARDVVRQEKMMKALEEEETNDRKGKQVDEVSHLPKARQQLLEAYSAPVTSVLNSSSSIISSISSTAASLPIIGNYLPGQKSVG